jgi:hypothetical protein
MVYTEEQVVESLFQSGGTLAGEGIEVKSHRKNAKDIYFTYKGKEFCLNRHNVILKFSDKPEGRYYQYAGLEFSDYQEYNKVLSEIKSFLGR